MIDMIEEASRLHLLGVALGAGAGAVVRAAVDRSIAAHVGRTKLPWATLVVNVVGSLILGAVLAATADAAAGSGGESARTIRLVVGTGFCGGLTTFSTFTVESFALLREGRPRSALAYAALTVGLGLSAVVVGERIGAAIG